MTPGVEREGADGRGPQTKIQSICNGKCAPITMQGLATPREKPLAQEQWRAMEKNNAQNNGNSRKSARVLTLSDGPGLLADLLDKQNARRRRAPGANSGH